MTFNSDFRVTIKQLAMVLWPAFFAILGSIPLKAETGSGQIKDPVPSIICAGAFENLSSEIQKSLEQGKSNIETSEVKSISNAVSKVSSACNNDPDPADGVSCDQLKISIAELKEKIEKNCGSEIGCDNLKRCRKFVCQILNDAPNGIYSVCNFPDRPQPEIFTPNGLRDNNYKGCSEYHGDIRSCRCEPNSECDRLYECYSLLELRLRDPAFRPLNPNTHPARPLLACPYNRYGQCGQCLFDHFDIVPNDWDYPNPGRQLLPSFPNLTPGMDDPCEAALKGRLNCKKMLSEYDKLAAKYEQNCSSRHDGTLVPLYPPLDPIGGTLRTNIEKDCGETPPACH